MATTYYLNNIACTGPSRRTAKDPKDQKALDRYWRRQDRIEAKHSKPEVKNLETATTNTVAKAATKKIKNKLKWTMIKIVAIILAVLVLIVMVYLNNVYVDPNYINIGASMNRSYSRASTLSLIQIEKDYQDAVNTGNDIINNILSSSNATHSTYVLSRTGLSEERFSTANGYIENFVDINEELLKIASEKGSFSLGGIEFDGLAYLAMANDESGDWMRDMNVTISSAYPSARVPLDSAHYIQQLNGMSFTMWMSTADNYLQFPSSVNACYNAPWIADPYSGTYTEQGPLTQAFDSFDAAEVLGASLSETDQLTDELKGLINAYSKQTLGLQTIQETCTGSKYPYYSGTMCDNGDRWNIRDSAAVFAHNQTKYSAPYITNYKYDGAPNLYETLCYVQLTHWHSNLGNNIDESKGPYAKVNAYLAHAHLCSSDQAIEIIRGYVKESIANGYYGLSSTVKGKLVQDIDKLMEELQVPIIVGDKQVGVLDQSCFNQSNLVQNKSELPAYLFNYIMLEELYSEGKEATS